MMATAVTPLAEVLHSSRKNMINVHTSYYENFFLLSVDVWVDGFPLQLEGRNQSSLGLTSPVDNVTIPFKMLSGAVARVAERFGVHQLARMRCGSCPLFEVDFTTKKAAMKFCKALAAGRVQDAMLESISSLVKHTLESSRLTVTNQLLFVTPKSTKSDAVLREVTRANCSECFEILCEGLAFDFGDLVRQCRLENNPQKEIQLPVLMTELEMIDHWFSLGVHLNIPTHELEKLKLTHGYRKEGMYEMLRVWMKTGEASYAMLVDALVGVGMVSLAKKIAMKYGIITETFVHEDSKKDDTPFQNAASVTMPGYVSALKEARHKVIMTDSKLFQLQREISHMETMRSDLEEQTKHTKLSIKQETKSIEQLNRELLSLQDQRNKKEQQKEWLMAQMTTKEKAMQMTAAIQMLQETAIFVQHLNHLIEEVESSVDSQKTEVENLELKLSEQERKISEKHKHLSELRLKCKAVRTTLWLERKHFDLQTRQMVAAQKSSKELQRELQNQIASLQEEVTHQKKEIDMMTRQSDENVNEIRQQQQLSVNSCIVTSLQERISNLQLQLTAFKRRKSPKITHKQLPSEQDSSDSKKQPSTVPLDESAKTSRSPRASPDCPSQDALVNNTIKVTLKKVKQQLGFSLTGGEREGRTVRIHSVAADGLASQDGRLREGDILVSINGEAVLGSHRDLAVAILESIPINTDIEIEVYRSESAGQQKTKIKSRAKRPQELGAASRSSIKAFDIVKSTNGFGFSIGDSTDGIIVKQILDKDRCSCLKEGDIIVAVSCSLGHQPLSPTSSVAKFVPYLKRIDIGSQATFHICRLPRTASPVSKSHEPVATPPPIVPVPYCVPVQSGDNAGSPLFQQPAPYNKLQHSESTPAPGVAVPYCIPVQSGESPSPLTLPSSYNRLQRAFDRRFSASQTPFLCREIRLTSQPSAGFGFRIRGGREEGFIPTVVYVTPGEAADNAGLAVGDQIIFVNGQPIADTSYNDIVKIIKEAAVDGRVTLSIDSSS